MYDSALLRLGIDDLAKFRVVQFVCSRPDYRGAAEDFASELGFRSAERTVATLDALVAARLLVRFPGHRGTVWYGLTRDSDRRQLLVELGLTGAVPVGDTGLIERLARHSLRQVRRWRPGRLTLRDPVQREVMTDGA
ncbi:MAG TPA: hypothetical protein VHL09_16495 [Dehalococcoidia bacterium]|nr:hypothetical protein [Dehalococcoidia bacterium]